MQSVHLEDAPLVLWPLFKLFIIRTRPHTVVVYIIVVVDIVAVVIAAFVDVTVVFRCGSCLPLQAVVRVRTHRQHNETLITSLVCLKSTQ